MVWIFTPNIPANTTNQDFPTCQPSRASLPGLERLESFYKGLGKRGSVIQSGDSGGEGKWMDLESYLQMESAGGSDRLDMGWAGQGEVRECCREKPILTPCWNYFFDLLFIAFVITIIYNSLPQRTLPLCLTVKLKCLCLAHRKIIWPCPPVKKKRLTHPFQRLVIPLEMFCKTEDPFTLFPHCVSLSILSFDFSSSLLLSLWSIKDPNKMVILRFNLLSLLAPWLKSLALTPHFLDSLACHAASRASWNSVTIPSRHFFGLGDEVL